MVDRDMDSIKNRILEHTQKVAFALGVEKELAYKLLSRGEPLPTEHNGDNIVVVGGGLENKGAQAMTFTVTDELSKRFPEKDIYLFSFDDYDKPATDKNKYEFEILPWDPEPRVNIMLPIAHRMNTTNYDSEVHDKIESVLKDCAFIVDISGYAFSSQRGGQRSFLYLSNILIANKLRIPMYILPQSIGPFNFAHIEKILLYPVMNTYLSYPKVICVRESQGVQNLSPFTLQNVKQEFDIVLQNEEYDLENIFTEVPDLREEYIRERAVGIVPNIRLMERVDKKQFYSYYEDIINTILSQERDVYILRHSVEDDLICKDIKQMFKNSDRVHLINEDMNAIELEGIIAQFDYLVGSRYHSIVHSYKSNVPVVAIGWAVKYRELLKHFDQLEYFFDGREDVHSADIIHSIERMSKNQSKESSKIYKKRKEIIQTGLFGEIL